jgi:hypothetical protein
LRAIELTSLLPARLLEGLARKIVVCRGLWIRL